jgi:hypothetical protein
MDLKPGKNNSTTNESIVNESLDGGNFSTKALNITDKILTPFHDLMCTSIDPGLSHQFAFKVGGKSLSKEIGVKASYIF